MYPNGSADLARCKVEVDTRDSNRVLAAMVLLVGNLRRSAGGRIWGIGVAMPGPLVATEISFVGPTVLEGWSDMRVLDDLRDAVSLPVFYSVDSVAGALGETLFGMARAMDNFFYMHFGMGLGGTLVVNRAAYRGANGNATEIGHIPVVHGGVPCYCGNAGCLERYVSLHSLAEALGLDDPVIHELPFADWINDTSQTAFHAWCQQAAARLRDAICIIENMLDPRTIIIGGSAPKVLVAHLIGLAQPLLKSVRGGLSGGGERILLSEKQEDSSILGAAVLPLYDMLAPNIDVLQQDRGIGADMAELLGQRGGSRGGGL